ncbi:MAG: hypothetical protein R3C13_08680 [Hyphomonas sp.]|uniref:hypothetical protein n=1 Tax=Hyphomonas sp. TaxID=87 RepID=UPI0035286CD8
MAFPLLSLALCSVSGTKVKAGRDGRRTVQGDEVPQSAAPLAKGDLASTASAAADAGNVKAKKLNANDFQTKYINFLVHDWIFTQPG